MAGVAEPRRPVPLRPGALRALLRQPDLPPDLVAKISARADHLARAEQQRGAGGHGWRSRMPVVVMVLAGLAATAGIAFLLSPAPPESAPASPISVPEEASARPSSAVPLPPPEAGISTQPASDEESIADAADAPLATTPEPKVVRAAPPAARAAPVVERANVMPPPAKAPSAGPVVARPKVPVPSRPSGSARADDMGQTAVTRTPAIVAPSVSRAAPPAITISEAAPAVTVDMPTTLPVLDLPAQR